MARSVIVLRAAIVGVVVALALGLSASPAWAHNTLVGADPAEGSVLQAPPSHIVFRFAKDVPLDTASLDLIRADGSRQALIPSRGASAKELTAPFPPDARGGLTIRWRLIGPDGHVLSERVRFSVEGSPTGPSPPVATDLAVVPADAEAKRAAPEPIKFVVRLAGFIAATVLGGIVAIALVVSPSLTSDRRVRRGAVLATGALAVTAVLGLWLLASDVGGHWPSTSLDDLGAALTLDAGRASLARVLLAGVLAIVLFSIRLPVSERGRWYVAGSTLLVLLATWSYAGHARIARWAWLGVPLDVVHYASAAAWLGGLLLMAAIVLPAADATAAVAAVQRFSSLAAVAVVALVSTGAAQGLRLVGGPGRLFGTGHGRLLLVKLVLLGGMLYVANVNRTRVQSRFGDPASTTRGMRRALHRAMVTESTLGLAVLAVTAVLVVTTPAMGTTSPPAPAAGAQPPTLRR